MEPNNGCQNLTCPGASDVIVLPGVPNCVSMLASKESVAAAVLIWAKRRVMNKTFNMKELQNLLDASHAAGVAEGYAKAKLEMALERAGVAPESLQHQETDVSADDSPSKAAKLEEIRTQAQKDEEEQIYTTRMTVSMTKTIALDYIKSVAPRVVGPSEIKKNSEKALDVFISFGTLNRAMAILVKDGEAELIEKSRWRYKGRADSLPLRSVK